MVDITDNEVVQEVIHEVAVALLVETRGHLLTLVLVHQNHHVIPVPILVPDLILENVLTLQ